jgi:hypothetical protein
VRTINLLQNTSPFHLPALAMTFVGLMQGASITQSLPNPDGLDSPRYFLAFS